MTVCEYYIIVIVVFVEKHFINTNGEGSDQMPHSTTPTLFAKALLWFSKPTYTSWVPGPTDELKPAGAFSAELSKHECLPVDLLA